jgi:hypothetical protein
MTLPDDVCASLRDLADIYLHFVCDADGQCQDILNSTEYIINITDDKDSLLEIIILYSKYNATSLIQKILTFTDQYSNYIRYADFVNIKDEVIYILSKRGGYETLELLYTLEDNDGVKYVNIKDEINVITLTTLHLNNNYGCLENIFKLLIDNSEVIDNLDATSLKYTNALIEHFPGKFTNIKSIIAPP